MSIVERALGAMRFRGESESHPTYEEMMTEALRRVRLSELQIRESRSVEELDIGRSTLQAAWADVQSIVRTAKRDRGIPLRSVEETEGLFRQMRDHFHHRKAAGD